jgi:hypothetical protein
MAAMDDPLAQAVLRAIHNLTKHDYGETDGKAIVGELERGGIKPDPKALSNLIRLLKDDLYIEAYMRGGGGYRPERAIQVRLTAYGRASMQGADPFDEVLTEARRSLASDRFAAAFPGAFGPWADAEKLLHGDDPEGQLTTIGHKVREAAQGFASALIAEYGAVSPDPDIKHVKNRLNAVIERHRAQLGPKRRVVLETLGSLWNASVELIERQEHAAQKEGEAVTWDDGRRIVYLSMFMMIEFVTILDELPPSDVTAPLGSMDHQQGVEDRD